MKEMFVKTVVACLALGTIWVGTQTFGRGALVFLDERIQSVLALREAQTAASKAAEETTAETIVEGLKRFGGIKLPK